MSKTTDTITSSFPSANYTFTQSAMFFLYYGMHYKMPTWVVWFPSIVAGGVILFVILILIIAGIIGLITK